MSLNIDSIRLICYGTIVITGPDYPDVFTEAPGGLDWTLIGTHKFSNVRGLKYVWGEFEAITYGFSIPEGGNPPPVSQIINVISKEPGDKNHSESGVRLDIRLDYTYRESSGGITRNASWEFHNVDPVEADFIDFTIPTKRDGRVPISVTFYVRAS